LKTRNKKPTHIASTFYFLQTHNANAEKNKKSLQSPTKKIHPSFFLRNLFFPPHGLTANSTDIALNVNRFYLPSCGLDTTLLWIDRRASGNSGFKKLAVQWLIEHSTSHQNLWWLDSFVLRNRQLLKPAKRQTV